VNINTDVEAPNAGCKPTLDINCKLVQDQKQDVHNWWNQGPVVKLLRPIRDTDDNYNSGQLSLLQHIPKTFNEFKVWTQRW